MFVKKRTRARPARGISFTKRAVRNDTIAVMTRGNTKQRLVITDGALARSFLEEAGAQAHVGLDTEFMRVDTYYPGLCLVQAALPGGRLACVDPMSVEPEILSDGLGRCRGNLCIHSAAQDLEVLKGSLRFLPETLFDTQIAAALLGRGEQVSYAALVQSLFGVELAKGATRTDWSRRPLSAAQVEYAFADVAYLLDIKEVLSGELERQDKRQWLEHACAELLDQYRGDAGSDVVARFKAGASVPVERQGLLRALVLWREGEAQRRNRPREWIVPGADLVSIARHAPTSAARLRSIAVSHPDRVSRYADVLLDIVSSNAGDSPAAPIWEPRVEMSAEQRALAKRLSGRVRAFCRDRSVSPAVLATRADLEALVLGRPGRLDFGWRREVLGEALDEVI